MGDRSGTGLGKLIVKVLYNLSPNCPLILNLIADYLKDVALNDEGTKKLYELVPAFSKLAIKLRKQGTCPKDRLQGTNNIHVIITAFYIVPGTVLTATKSCQ